MVWKVIVCLGLGPMSTFNFLSCSLCNSLTQARNSFITQKLGRRSRPASKPSKSLKILSLLSSSYLASYKQSYLLCFSFRLPPTWRWDGVPGRPPSSASKRPRHREPIHDWSLQAPPATHGSTRCKITAVLGAFVVYRFCERNCVNVLIP